MKHFFIPMKSTETLLPSHSVVVITYDIQNRRWYHVSRVCQVDQRSSSRCIMHADAVTIPHLSTNSKHRIFHASPTALYIDADAAAAAAAAAVVIVAAALFVVLLPSLCCPVVTPSAALLLSGCPPSAGLLSSLCSMLELSKMRWGVYQVILSVGGRSIFKLRKWGWRVKVEGWLPIFSNPDCPYMPLMSSCCTLPAVKSMNLWRQWLHNRENLFNPPSGRVHASSLWTGPSIAGDHLLPICIQPTIHLRRVCIR